MKTFIITLYSLIISTALSFGQHAHFTSSGTVEYQKTANMFAIMKRVYSTDILGGLQTQVYESYTKTQPQFKVTRSTLSFADNKSLFKPIPNTGPVQGFTTPLAEQINTIYTDFATQSTVTEKDILDSYVLVKDSLRKIKWKITGETREIAGYPCRRADGLVLDSVYIIAFYTDKIPVSGGPESLNGLPGMILQAQLKYENITWVATKVTEVEIPAGTIVPPKKGKPMTPKQLIDFGKSLFGKQLDVRSSMMIRGLMF